jgi:hypothetical protein
MYSVYLYYQEIRGHQTLHYNMTGGSIYAVHRVDIRLGIWSGSYEPFRQKSPQKKKEEEKIKTLIKRKNPSQVV